SCSGATLPGGGVPERRACCIDSWVPTHSSTASAPMPSVNSLMRSTPSSPRSVTMSVAPNSRASFCRDSWRLMATHGDDPRSTLLLRGQYPQKADGAVTDDHDRRVRFDVGRVGGEPAGAHDVR